MSDRLAARERPRGGSPVMFQTWRELLFLHWEWDPADLQRTLPAGLTVDTHEGRAYLGVVPFLMRNIRPRFCPSVPGISNFLEANVRTYVVDESGTPGVWFYSLDANQWLAVRVARRFFQLPYYDARMRVDLGDESAEGHPQIRYTTARRGAAPETASEFEYRGTGAVRTADPGTLEFFLVERYVLFAEDARRGRIRAGRVHHEPYPILDAEVTEWGDGLIELNGFDRPGRSPDHALISRGVDVDVFALE